MVNAPSSHPVLQKVGPCLQVGSSQASFCSFCFRKHWKKELQRHLASFLLGWWEAEHGRLEQCKRVETSSVLAGILSGVILWSLGGPGPQVWVKIVRMWYWGNNAIQTKDLKFLVLALVGLSKIGCYFFLHKLQAKLSYQMATPFIKWFSLQKGSKPSVFKKTAFNQFLFLICFIYYMSNSCDAHSFAYPSMFVNFYSNKVVRNQSAQI